MATTANKGILLESGTNELEIIELYIDEEGGGYRGYYGVNVAKVIEIISMPLQVHKPPNAANFVVGVFNHRGKVILLIDLALWLGKDRLKEKPPIVVITEFNNVTSAFLVSGVTRIHRTSWANIKPLDTYLQRFTEAVTGMILLENRTVLMLDLERIIGELDPRLAVPLLQEDIDEAVVPVALSTAIQYPLKVLHADDSGMIRRATKKLLEEKKEFIVTSVVDGREAWEYLEDLKKKVAAHNKPVTDFLDIILSDIEMPGMDGYHLCQRVKSDVDLRRLPVVLFSSLITDKLRHKGESVGADGQLTKPSPAELVRDLKEIVRKYDKTS
jgi:two-component system, chemotaxis family, chemotaxis protein CheV